MPCGKFLTLKEIKKTYPRDTYKKIKARRKSLGIRLWVYMLDMIWVLGFIVVFIMPVWED